MLEVIESDLAKGLTILETEENTAEKEYNEQTAENKQAKALKEQAIVMKTKEVKGLGKSISEASTDLDGVQTELDAVNEYWAKIQEECVAKPDTYEEKRKRQEATLQGLQEAMTILGGRAALVQAPRHMRGSYRHKVVARDSPDDENSP